MLRLCTTCLYGIVEYEVNHNFKNEVLNQNVFLFVRTCVYVKIKAGYSGRLTKQNRVVWALKTGTKHDAALTYGTENLFSPDLTKNEMYNQKVFT